jgi:magnesium-transporting ATPase (P-type)
MLKFIERCDNCEIEDYRNKYCVQDDHEPMRFQFDSARKRMSTILTIPEDEQTENNYNKRLHIKGASEIVLETCKYYINS